MNNLTTRRIILGLLMTLVLAFGVPGVVDAVRDPKLKQSSSDFFKLRTPNEDFSIRVSLPFDVPADSASTPETVTITFSSGITPKGIFLGETLTTPGLTLTESGGRDAVAANPDADPPIRAVSAANGNEYTFGSDGETNSTTITIEGRFTNTGSVAEQTVAISSPGWTEGNTNPTTYTYYYYVTNPNGSSSDIVALTHDTSSRFLGFDDDAVASDESGYVVGDFGDADIQIFAGDSSAFNPVLYNPRSSLFMSHTNYKGGEKVNLLSGHISSAFAIYLKKNSSTDVVTAQVRGRDTSIITGVYIYGYPTLEVDAPTGREKGSEENPGKPGEVIANAFTATVKDRSNRGVPGVPVKFEIPSGSATNGELGFGSGNTGTLVDMSNQLIFDGNTQIAAGTGTTLYVRTNGSGKASVNCRLITGNVPVTVTAVAESDSTAAVYTAAASGKQLTALSARSSLINADAYDLFVLVTYDGEPVDPGTTPPEADVPAVEFDVIFRTSDGNFGATSPNTKTTATPNSDGIAQVRFTPDGSSSNPQVTASLEETNSGVTRSVDTVTFDVTSGAPTTRRDDSPPPVQQTNRLTISTTGEGTTRSVTVNALTAANAPITGLQVTLSGTALTTSRTVTTGTPVTITLPSTPDTYTLIATDPNAGFDPATINVPVSAPGTLSLEEIGARSANGGQSIRVTVREANGSLASGSVVVTLSGIVTRTVPTTNGTGAAIITLPTTGGPHTVTLSATGYTTQSFTFSATGQTPPGQTTPGTTPPSGPAGVADSLEIDGSRQLSGTLNQAMRLRARVVDANDNGVGDVGVTFRVLQPGRGTFAGARGNGRGIVVDTDRNGYASANFTPTSDGDVIVRANAAGVSAPVTFIIDVGEASETDTGTRDVGVSEVAVDIDDAVVHVGAAQRPRMLWVDGGGIYALVGASVERFAPSVDNALNLTVAGGKVYWTEQTGESAGTINSADLDGSDVEQLKAIKAVPMGIAVDTAARKLYWTNSRGRIQSADFDGSGIENVLQNLPAPKDIAVARGNVYWTQYDATAGAGSVGIANSTGRGTPKYISTGSDTPGSLAIANGKVYWTERTGTNSGTINSANLNGSGAKQLKAIRAVPMGIAVDASRSKLYWTNSRGRVQSANLDGSQVETVVDGLGSPGDMVLSNSLKAPVSEAESSSGSGTETGKSKYDINDDGSVDTTDVDLLLLAILAELTNAKYDVNTDGKVDIADVRAVNANLDAGAAGAPTLLGKQFSALEVSRLQEQIDLLIATGDRSPAAMRTLIYLQQLIATARPEKTQLFANYPNPFNPETWIPYELATDTNVRITIYNAQGVVIRTLELGQQAPGYYVGRDRAAYWDGRNALGEHVASGIYFYQLETDTMSAMRKMVILK